MRSDQHVFLSISHSISSADRAADRVRELADISDITARISQLGGETRAGGATYEAVDSAFYSGETAGERIGQLKLCKCASVQKKCVGPFTAKYSD